MNRRLHEWEQRRLESTSGRSRVGESVELLALLASIGDAVVSRKPEAIHRASELLFERLGTTNPLHRLDDRRQRKFRELLADSVHPDESILVACAGTLSSKQRGVSPSRLLNWATLGLYRRVRSIGILSVTDHRLLFHRTRWRNLREPGTLFFARPLAAIDPRFAGPAPAWAMPMR